MRLYMEDVRWKDALNADLKTQSNGGMTDTSAEIVAVNSKAAEKKSPRGSLSNWTEIFLQIMRFRGCNWLS